MPKKLQSNEDLMRDLMRYSPHGALCQAFIIEAVSRYCDQCIKAGPEAFDSAMMSGAAWVGIARDIRGRLDAFYGRHSATPAAPDA